MFEHKGIATAVSNSSEKFIADLNSALNQARETLAPDEYERFRKSVGIVVGTIEVDMLSPLYKTHPDLEPETLKDGNQ